MFSVHTFSHKVRTICGSFLVTWLWDWVSIYLFIYLHMYVCMYVCVYRYMYCFGLKVEITLQVNSKRPTFFLLLALLFFVVYILGGFLKLRI